MGMRRVPTDMPLTLRGIYNRRSSIALGRSVSLILSRIGCLAAANQAFLAAEGEDLSSPSYRSA
jgi:hypothetical protein